MELELCFSAYLCPLAPPVLQGTVGGANGSSCWHMRPLRISLSGGSYLRYRLGAERGQIMERMGHIRVRFCRCYPHLAPAKLVVLKLYSLKIPPPLTFLNLNCSSVICS